jgi:hypothetical protein
MRMKKAARSIPPVHWSKRADRVYYCRQYTTPVWFHPPAFAGALEPGPLDLVSAQIVFSAPDYFAGAARDFENNHGNSLGSS